MYVCICEQVRECDVRAAIRCGARTEAAVGEACGAGTACGSCLERIADLIDEAPGLLTVAAMRHESAETVAPLAA